MAANPPTDLQKFYIEQRDKHLAQFMAINGAAVFSVLGIIFAALVNLQKVDPLEEATLCARVAMLLIGATGIVLLTIAAVMLSMFHTGRVRRFQRLALQPAAALDKQDFEVIHPSGAPHFLVLLGLLLLIADVVWMLVLKLDG